MMSYKTKRYKKFHALAYWVKIVLTSVEHLFVTYDY